MSIIEYKQKNKQYNEGSWIAIEIKNKSQKVKNCHL